MQYRHRKYWAAILGLAVLPTGLVGEEPPRASGPAPSSLQQRRGDYEKAKSRARAWLDALEVDPVDLLRHGVKGKKKLAEILDIYLSLRMHSKDGAERAGIQRRVEVLAKQAARPEYHDLLSLSDAEFIQNSMSYLRVAWLLGRLGADTAPYLAEIRRAKPRLDAHLSARGPWQRTMFLEYYERLGLAWPEGVPAQRMEGGVIARRLRLEAYQENEIYDLTHEVFVAFDYGARKDPARLSAEDRAYAREILPKIARRLVAARNHDLAGEVLSCLTYLGERESPAARDTIAFLLDGQNQNGTWGQYEAYRPQFGKYLDQHLYLHTTLVVLQSLLEAFEGEWSPPSAPAPEKPGPVKKGN